MANAAITVDLNAKIANFETELKRATGTLDRFGRRGNAVSAGLKSAFAGLAAGLSVGALAAFAKSSIDSADALNDMSQRLGVSVKDLASFQLAAEQSGTSLEGVGAGIARLTRSIGEAEGGNEKIAKTLKDLGVSARDPKEAFFQLADAVQRIDDPATRAALLTQVLGKSYQDLIPLLSQGSEELRKSAAESENFATAMARLAPNADKLNDQLALLKINAAGAAGSILSELVPSLSEYLGALNEIVNRGSLADKALFFGLGHIPEEVANKVGNLTDRINLYQAKIRELQDAGKDASKEIATLNTLLEKKVVELNKPPKRAVAPSTPEPAKASTKPKSAAEPIDVFGNQSYITKDKAVAAFIRDEQEAINSLNRAMYQDGVQAAEAYQNRLSALLADTDVAKIEKYLSDIDFLNQAFFDGEIDAERYAQAMENLTGKTSAVGEEVKKADSMANDLGLTFASAFEDAIVGGKGLSDVLKGLEQDMLRLMTRKLVTEPLADMGTSFIKSFDWTSLFSPNASGGVYSAPSLSAYSGKIVSSPTVFPFASGIGLMGEAGAEAIMPLKRGADGKLGVSGGGSNVVVNVVEAPGKGGQQQQRNEGGTNIFDIYVEQIKSSIAGDITRGSGAVPAALAGTYGLNRVAGAW